MDAIFEIQNPWRKQAGFHVEPYMERTALAEMLSWIDDPRALVLTGPRQSGKTTLLWKLIEVLLGRGISPQAIFYFNFDHLQLREMFKDAGAFLRFLRAAGAPSKTWIFLDEVQRLPNPGLTLKMLTDVPGHPYKLFVSGSSSLELRAKTKESLTGRQIHFEILPLSFQERFRPSLPKLAPPASPEEWEKLHAGVGSQLQSLLTDMLLFGGYPALAPETVHERKRRILLELYNDYVEKDIQNFLQVSNVSAFNRLVKLLVFQHANLANKAALAGPAGTDQKTVDQYLRLLQETYVIHLLPPYAGQRRKEIVRMPKVYFNDVGLANAIAQRFDPPDERADLGALMENFVLTELKKGSPPGTRWYFWRTLQGAEVDFVAVQEGRLLPIEVKSGGLRKPEISRSLRSFVESYRPRRALVLNQTLYQKIGLGGAEVLFLPLTAFLIDVPSQLKS